MAINVNVSYRFNPDESAQQMPGSQDLKNLQATVNDIDTKVDGIDGKVEEVLDIVGDSKTLLVDGKVDQLYPLCKNTSDLIVPVNTLVHKISTFADQSGPKLDQLLADVAKLVPSGLCFDNGRNHVDISADASQTFAGNMGNATSLKYFSMYGEYKDSDGNKIEDPFKAPVVTVADGRFSILFETKSGQVFDGSAEVVYILYSDAMVTGDYLVIMGSY